MVSDLVLAIASKHTHHTFCDLSWCGKHLRQIMRSWSLLELCAIESLGAAVLASFVFEGDVLLAEACSHIDLKI